MVVVPLGCLDDVNLNERRKEMIDCREITRYLGAGYSCFWIETAEPRRAAEAISKQLNEFTRKDGHQYVGAAWDCTNVEQGKGINPLQPILTLDKAEDFMVMVLKNYHWYIEKPQIIQSIENRVEVWKGKGQAIVIISPSAKLPPELEKDFLLMGLPLPGDEEIVDTITFMQGGTKGDKLTITDEKRDLLVRSGKGLGRLELENSLALSFVTTGSFEPVYLGEHKAMAVERQGLLEVVKTDLTLEDVVGYDQIKEFAWPIQEDHLGFMSIGPTGTGKTYFMYCLCGQSGLPTFKLDAGKLTSKFRGEGDRLTREAQEMLTAVGECNLIIDEFEKQFAGAGGDGTLDSGSTKRETGKWLEFLEIKNRPKGVHVFGTCNSFIGIPPEYFRPGRWDSAPFFIDLPTQEEQVAILAYWAERYGLPPQGLGTKDMVQWTGAEIFACCHSASTRNWDLAKAARFILPAAKTNQEQVDALRHWAMGGDKWVPGKGRAIPATSVSVSNGPIKRQSVRLDA